MLLQAGCCGVLLGSVMRFRFTAARSNEWRFYRHVCFQRCGFRDGVMRPPSYSLARRAASPRAELVAILGGGVPQRLLCPSEQASAQDGCLTFSALAVLEAQRKRPSLHNEAGLLSVVLMRK